MWLAFKAGVAYFALIFTVGFALGTVRVLVLAPRVGPLWAVIAEAPVILIASWIVCGWILRRFAVPPESSSRLAMGGVAFGLLLGAEAALSAIAFGRGPAAYFASFGTAEGVLGLAGQIAYALFPLFRLRTGGI